MDRTLAGTPQALHPEYVRILETYYDEAGRHKQRVVANLGRLDKIAPRLAELAKDLAALPVLRRTLEERRRGS